MTQFHNLRDAQQHPTERRDKDSDHPISYEAWLDTLSKDDLAAEQMDQLDREREARADGAVGDS